MSRGSPNDNESGEEVDIFIGKMGYWLVMGMATRSSC